MKIIFNLLIIIVISALDANLYAQKDLIIGFWEIKKVEVGEENMTPVAKWTKINADGTFQSGNGWLQNSSGNWNYNIENNHFTTIDSLDILDEYGGFSVSFENENMYWERNEDGTQVKIQLSPIKELPMSPADYLQGIWVLTDITKNNQSTFDETESKEQQKLFIRWDRIYIQFDGKGNKSTGYWHIHGHKPQLILLPHNEEQNPESWNIEVDNKSLIMSGLSTTNRDIKRKYKRRNSF